MLRICCRDNIENEPKRRCSKTRARRREGEEERERAKRALCSRHSLPGCRRSPVDSYQIKIISRSPHFLDGLRISSRWYKTSQRDAETWTKLRDALRDAAARFHDYHGSAKVSHHFPFLQIIFHDLLQILGPDIVAMWNGQC